MVLIFLLQMLCLNQTMDVNMWKHILTGDVLLIATNSVSSNYGYPMVIL